MATKNKKYRIYFKGKIVAYFDYVFKGEIAKLESEGFTVIRQIGN